MGSSKASGRVQAGFRQGIGQDEGKDSDKYVGKGSDKGSGKGSKGTPARAQSKVWERIFAGFEQRLR